MNRCMLHEDLTSIARTCLNGWWDFQPVLGDSADGRIDLAAGVPQDGSGNGSA